jgi:hypothetical protein
VHRSGQPNEFSVVADAVEAPFGSEVAVIVAVVGQAGGLAIFQVGKEVKDRRVVASALRALAVRLDPGESH